MTKFKFPECAVWLRKVENLAVTVRYLWLTEKLGLLGDTAPPPPRAPLLNINYIPTIGSGDGAG